MTNLDNSIMQNLAPIYEQSKSAILELNNHIPRTKEVLQSYRRLLESIIDMHAQLILWEQKNINSNAIDRMNKWISCSERLPDFDIQVLVWHEGISKFAKRIRMYNDTSKRDISMWYMEGIVWSTETIITKWMPLREDEQQWN